MRNFPYFTSFFVSKSPHPPYYIIDGKWCFMKIVVVGEDKIKVELSGGDLTQMNITPEALLEKTAEVESLLSKIIMAVVRETGVFIENGRIFVELDSKNGANITLVSDSLKRRQKSVLRQDRLIFEFSYAEDVFLMLSAVDERYLKKMALYKLGKLFYVVMPRFPLPIELWEFSKKCKRSKLLEAVLAEHGRLVAEGDGILKMAEAIKR